MLIRTRIVLMTLTLAPLLAGAAAPVVNDSATEKAPVEKAAVEQALEVLKTYDWNKPRVGLRPIERAVVDWRSDTAARKDLERRLSAELQGRAPRGAKAFICQQLGRIGSADSVPALATLLADAGLSHSARIALERIGGAEAMAALRAALGKTSGLVQVGMINSLADCHDRASVPMIAPLVASGDGQTSLAAAAALGKIAGDDAAKVLAAALPKSQDSLHAAIADSYLRCADGMLAEKRSADAAAIYEALYDSHESRPIHLAAAQGLCRSRGPQTVAIILRMLADNDADARSIAARNLQTLDEANLGPVLEKFDAIPPRGQALVLDALAAPDHRSSLPTVHSAAKSRNPQVRAAALRALGRLGDARMVELLSAELSREDEVARAASSALAAIPDPDADAAIIAALKVEKDAPRRAGLIAVLSARKVAAAVPVLLAQASGDDARVRAAAVAALCQLAQPGDVPGMVRALRKAEGDKAHEEAEKAIAAVCLRASEREDRADPVLAEIARADDDDKALQLLPVLGRIGGAEALKIVKDALRNGQGATYDAAVRAISNWPDATVADDLLDLARNAKHEQHRLRALRALIRVVAKPGPRPPAEKLGYLKAAMQLATRDEERRLIIERAAAIRTTDALAFVVPYLDDKTLAEAACKAVCDLAHPLELRIFNQAPFNKALDKVLRVTKDEKLRARAKVYKSGP